MLLWGLAVDLVKCDRNQATNFVHLYYDSDCVDPVCRGRLLLWTDMTHWRLKISLAVLLAICVPHVLAQTDEHESDSENAATQESHRNYIAGFIGGAHEGRRDIGLALGISYGRKLSESFGIGVIAEHTYGDFDIWVYAVPFAYLTGPWKLYVAPGVEDGEEGSESLVRLGAEYAFEVGAIEVAPHLAMDFVGGEKVLVLGVVFGKSF